MDRVNLDLHDQLCVLLLQLRIYLLLGNLNKQIHHPVPRGTLGSAEGWFPELCQVAVLLLKVLRIVLVC